MLGKRQKGLKLTVSCCVSEKKRSDDNSIEVLIRTRKALQKAYQFTQNVTSKAWVSPTEPQGPLSAAATTASAPS